MIYSTERRREVLYEGVYKGFRFVILNLGTHPVAYVECKIQDCNGYDDDRLYNIGVHGGFTYYGEPYWTQNDGLKYLGWDYAHCEDYCGFMSSHSTGKRWTTKEIFEEVISVIEQLQEVW